MRRMSDMQLMEVDEETATALSSKRSRAALRWLNLVAELVPVVVDADTVAELDRRWDAISTGAETVPHEDVKHWLQTWGTPAFKPWRDQ
jgi:predicted transcriptional regulator